MVTIIKRVEAYHLVDALSKVDVFGQSDPPLRHNLAPFRGARVSGLLEDLHFPCFVTALTFSEMKSLKDRDLHEVLLNCEINAFYAKMSLLQALVLMVPGQSIYILFRSLRWIRD